MTCVDSDVGSGVNVGVFVGVNVTAVVISIVAASVEDGLGVMFVCDGAFPPSVKLHPEVISKQQPMSSHSINLQGSDRRKVNEYIPILPRALFHTEKSNEHMFILACLLYLSRNVNYKMILRLNNSFPRPHHLFC